jgi:hypothetical protein
MAALLCAALLAAAAAAPASAQGSTQSSEKGSAQLGVEIAEKVFENANFLQYYYQPRGQYIYNGKRAFQWMFGFNELYDDFAFVANCYVDTLRCKFTYGCRDWLVQLWKGSYGVCLAVGGEIGVYAKPKGWPVEHYAAPLAQDWIGMEMTIYNGERALFTRPFDRYWWCTGYQVGYLDSFYEKPRVACAMTGKIQMQNEEMARLLAGCLAEKGFVEAKRPPDAGSAETYCLEGDTVYFSWRNVTESWY